MENRPLCVFASDTHLRPCAWASRPGLRNDAIHAFQQIVRYTIKNKIPNLALAGDIFDIQGVDNNDKAVILKQVRQELDKLAKAKIRVLFIQGQHDLNDPPWMLALDRHAEHLHDACVPLTVEAEGDDAVWLAGLDYTPPDKLQNLLDGIESQAKVLMAHQVWGEFMGSVTSPDGYLKDVPRVPVIVTGDFHQRQELDLQIAPEHGKKFSRKVYSCGSTCMQEISEPVAKYFGVMYADLSWKWLKLKTRPVITLGVLHDEEQLVKAIETGKQMLEATEPFSLGKPIVRLWYYTDIPDVTPRLEFAFRESSFLFMKPKKAEHGDSEVRDARARTVASQGLLACLDSYVDDHNHPAYRLCRAMLASNDPAKALREIRAESLGVDA